MCKPQNIIENLQISNDINLDALYEFMALGCTGKEMETKIYKLSSIQ